MSFQSYVGALFWDPKVEVLTIPLFDLPIVWYGVFFSLGFLLGYLLLYRLLLFWFKSRGVNLETRCSLAYRYTDMLSFYMILGTVVGARLGHLIFYEKLEGLLLDPLVIFRIREGGLASHGAVVGILVALMVFCRRYKEVSFVALLDLLAIPAAFIGFFIRMGNFFNQEILGTVSRLPWAVVFGHPFDGSIPIPRHPVQLYEGFFYLFLGLFFILLFYKTSSCQKAGRISGLLLTVLFSFRFLIEGFKEEQSQLEPLISGVMMGQFLSIPFICLGVTLLFVSFRSTRAAV